MNGRRHDANTLGEVWPKTRAMPKQWWMTNDALPVMAEPNCPAASATRTRADDDSRVTVAKKGRLVRSAGPSSFVHARQ